MKFRQKEQTSLKIFNLNMLAVLHMLNTINTFQKCSHMANIDYGCLETRGCSTSPQAHITPLSSCYSDLNADG